MEAIGGASIIARSCRTHGLSDLCATPAVRGEQVQTYADAIAHSSRKIPLARSTKAITSGSNLAPFEWVITKVYHMHTKGRKRYAAQKLRATAACM